LNDHLTIALGKAFERGRSEEAAYFRVSDLVLEEIDQFFPGNGGGVKPRVSFLIDDILYL
jgi:hypothetical protein